MNRHRRTSRVTRRRGGRGRWGAWALALLLWPWAAAAQEASLPPTPAQRCLSLVDQGREVPEYPLHELQLGVTGRVKVRMSFTLPDRPPAVEVLAHEGGDASIQRLAAQPGADAGVVALGQIGIA